MRMKCPHCGISGTAATATGGRLVRCPRCSELFLLPAIDGSEPDALSSEPVDQAEYPGSEEAYLSSSLTDTEQDPVEAEALVDESWLSDVLPDEADQVEPDALLGLSGSDGQETAPDDVSEEAGTVDLFGSMDDSEEGLGWDESFSEDAGLIEVDKLPGLTEADEEETNPGSDAEEADTIDLFVSLDDSEEGLDWDEPFAEDEGLIEPDKLPGLIEADEEEAPPGSGAEDADTIDLFGSLDGGDEEPDLLLDLPEDDEEEAAPGSGAEGADTIDLAGSLDGNKEESDLLDLLEDDEEGAAPGSAVAEADTVDRFDSPASSEDGADGDDPFSDNTTLTESDALPGLGMADSPEEPPVISGEDNAAAGPVEPENKRDVPEESPEWTEDFDSVNDLESDEPETPAKDFKAADALAKGFDGSEELVFDETFGEELADSFEFQEMTDTISHLDGAVASPTAEEDSQTETTSGYPDFSENQINWKDQQTESNSDSAELPDGHELPGTEPVSPPQPTEEAIQDDLDEMLATTCVACDNRVAEDQLYCPDCMKKKEAGTGVSMTAAEESLAAKGGKKKGLWVKLGLMVVALLALTGILLYQLGLI